MPIVKARAYTILGGFIGMCPPLRLNLPLLSQPDHVCWQRPHCRTSAGPYFWDNAFRGLDVLASKPAATGTRKVRRFN
jgi:hypothetical protein